MTPHPTTREDRDELRMAHKALNAKDAEIFRLKAQLAKLRDGIAEVISVKPDQAGVFKLPAHELVGTGDAQTPYTFRVSPAGAKLAQLWRESQPQETK